MTHTFTLRRNTQFTLSDLPALFVLIGILLPDPVCWLVFDYCSACDILFADRLNCFCHLDLSAWYFSKVSMNRLASLSVYLYITDCFTILNGCSRLGPSPDCAFYTALFILIVILLPGPVCLPVFDYCSACDILFADWSTCAWFWPWTVFASSRVNGAWNEVPLQSWLYYIM